MLELIGRKGFDANADLVEIGYQLFALKYEFESPFRLCEGTKIWEQKERCFLVYELTQTLPSHTLEELESSISRISDFLRNR